MNDEDGSYRRDCDGDTDDCSREEIDDHRHGGNNHLFEDRSAHHFVRVIDLDLDLSRGPNLGPYNLVVHDFHVRIPRMTTEDRCIDTVRRHVEEVEVQSNHYNHDEVVEDLQVQLVVETEPNGSGHFQGDYGPTSTLGYGLDLRTLQIDFRIGKGEGDHHHDHPLAVLDFHPVHDRFDMLIPKADRVVLPLDLHDNLVPTPGEPSTSVVEAVTDDRLLAHAATAGQESTCAVPATSLAPYRALCPYDQDDQLRDAAGPNKGRGVVGTCEVAIGEEVLLVLPSLVEAHDCHRVDHLLHQNPNQGMREVDYPSQERFAAAAAAAAVDAYTGSNAYLPVTMDVLTLPSFVPKVDLIGIPYEHGEP